MEGAPEKEKVGGGRVLGFIRTISVTAVTLHTLL